MTIRFIRAWNGHAAGDVATLSADEESRLVGLGIASSDFAADQSGPLFDSIDQFLSQAGGSVNAGPIWIAGQQYNSRFVFDSLPGFVLVGDSTAALGNDSGTVALTASGATVTVTRTSHGCLPGSVVYLTNANESEYNFIGTVQTVIDANSFTMIAPISPSVSPATGTPVMVNQQRIKDAEWANISNWMSHGKGLYIGNFACGGTRTSALMDQLDIALDRTKNLWGVDPDIVFISTGINDAINDILSTEMIANLKSAINRVLAFGAIPVVLTTFPYENNATSWSVSRIREARKYNQWIRENVVGMGGIVVDANTVCIDSDNQYGNWKTGYSLSDGVHPGKKASFQVAKAIKAQLWDNVTSVDTRTLTIINTNPTLTGTGGVTSGTGASGDVANSFTLTAAGGGSQLVAGTKGIGLSGNSESQRVDITAVASLDRGQFALSSQISGSITPEKSYLFKCRLRATSLPEAFRYVQSTLSLTISGTSASQASGLYGSGTESWGEAFDMIIETPLFTIPETGLTSFTNRLDMAFQSPGNAIFDISDFGIYEIN